MFRGIYSDGDNVFRQMLIPLLTAANVSQATLHALYNGCEFVVVPWYFGWFIPLCRLLPVGVYDAMASLAGATHSMSGFQGRTPARKQVVDTEQRAAGASSASVVGAGFTWPGSLTAHPLHRRRRSGRAGPVQAGGGDTIYTAL